MSKEKSFFFDRSKALFGADNKGRYFAEKLAIEVLPEPMQRSKAMDPDIKRAMKELEADKL